ncbi:MAG: lipopolysaccharide biosynthesis protein [Deinococcota bacterium]|nr:lipopolysaccharide biosynthesis protein [Deinococcota bacterium]
MPRSDFGRHVLTLLSGTTVAQAIPIALSPILTRLYTPEHFGVFALYLATASLVGVVATARYEMAVMLPERDDDAVNLMALAMLISLLVSLVTLVVVWLFNAPITAFLGNAEVSRWLYLVPLTVLLTGVYQTLHYWSSRKEKFGRLALSRVAQTGTATGTQLGLGLVRAGSGGLVAGSVFGQGVATAVLGWQVWRDDRDRAAAVGGKAMLRQAKSYQDFPKINSLHALTDVVKTSGTFFLLGNLFSTATVGQYQLMTRILAAPLSLVGQAITQVFYRQASSLYNQGQDLRPVISSLLKKLALIALVPALILLALAPGLFAFVFGEQWRAAGEFSRLLVPYTFGHFLVSPLAYIPFIADRQLQALGFSLTGNLLYLACIVYAGWTADLSTGLLLISVVLPVYFAVYILWIFSIAKPAA